MPYLIGEFRRGKGEFKSQCLPFSLSLKSGTPCKREMSVHWPGSKTVNRSSNCMTVSKKKQGKDGKLHSEERNKRKALRTKRVVTRNPSSKRIGDKSTK